MKTIKPDNLSIMFKVFEAQGRYRLAISASGFFSLQDGTSQRLLGEEDMWPHVEAALGKDEVFDFGVPKIRGEFLVYGSAFSPRPVEALDVRVRVGTISKTLSVFGNRYWKAGLVSGTPLPYDRMRIGYENAFGGAGYPPNPSGKGFTPDESGMKPLPNVQDPKHLLASPHERATPAGFTAYPITWPQRMKWMGPLDERYLLESWPYFPKGTRPEFFNTAPEDQRLDGFFRGDEEIEMVHMHPQKPVLVSALPGLRARLFVNQEEDGQEVFREVPCRAETVWLFPDRERGIVLYRGALSVADEEYEDVLHLYARWEALNEAPKPAEHYRRLFVEELGPPAEVAPPGGAPAPEEGTVQPEVEGAEPSALPALRPELVRLAKEAKALESRSMEMLKKAGVDPDEVMKKILEPEPAAGSGSLRDLERMSSDLEAQAKGLLAKFHIDEKNVLKFMEPKPEPPIVSTDEIIARLRGTGIQKPEIEALLKEVGRLRQEALAGLEALKKKAGEAEKAREGPASKYPEHPPGTPTAGAPLTVAQVLAMVREGKSLAHLDLTGLDFSGQGLAGADFAEAVLDKAVFRNADLSGAVFTGGILTGADLSEANLREAGLKGVNASQARLTGAFLRGADLSEGDFTQSDFSGAFLTDALLSGVVLEGARMTAVQGQRVHAPGGAFMRADLTRADLSGAELEEADFSGAVLSGANFTGVKAEGLRLYGARGHRPVFEGALLKASRADRDTSFAEGDFRGAVLSRSNWEGADLSKANMTGAVLDKADMTKTILIHAVLRLARARETNFMKADLRGADMTAINLFKGVLRKATLWRTVMRSSNLYGVDLYRAKMGEADLSGANIKKTLLSVKVQP